MQCINVVRICVAMLYCIMMDCFLSVLCSSIIMSMSLSIYIYTHTHNLNSNGQVPEFDNFYLDMNGIIHMCSHPNDDDPTFRIPEDRIFAEIFRYIEVIYDTCIYTT